MQSLSPPGPEIRAGGGFSDPIFLGRIPMTDYYATLGIAKSATGEDIKKAWRRAAQRFHPDATHDSTTAVFS